MKKFLPFLVTLLLVTLPWIAHARFMSEAERACGREAAERYQNVLLQSLRTYHQDLETGIEKRNRAYIDSWDSEEERDQRQRERDAKNIFRDESREIRKEKSRRDSEAERLYSDERRACHDLTRRDSDVTSSRMSSSRTSSARSSSSSSSSSSSRNVCLYDTECPHDQYCDGRCKLRPE